MLDGIKISKSTIGYSVDLSRFEETYQSRGWKGYKIKNHEEIDIRYNQDRNILELEGSLPYHFQGHNLYSSYSSFVSCIIELGSLIGIDLTDATIIYFEFGIVLKSQFNIKHIMSLHLSTNIYKVTVYETGKVFVHGDFIIKLYDAGETFGSKKVTKLIRDQIKRLGEFSKGDNYIKIEILYKRPLKCFERRVTIADLLDSSFHQFLHEDLKEKYRSLIIKSPVKISIVPQTLDCIGIYASLLFELLIHIGQEPKQYVLERIDEMNCLNKYAKSRRRGTTNTTFQPLYSQILCNN